jgi:hypothetical protein
MAPRLVELQTQSSTSIGAARAAGYSLGRHEAQAAHVWRSAGEPWDRVKHARRFWD